ncbi:MAG: cobaltochelatase subunit CobN [Bacteroides sp.]|nr:cobaltochelatase subunit CobN [Roseburia sp.]MCM1346700.1 cobaltochelatase subunit CobN [Bacteroides sp.]MCM1419940.1 cobaltochelatase subunit CobN [Bacteroides sp.]
MNKKIICLSAVVLTIIVCAVAYRYWLAPTRILMVNFSSAQIADIALNNDSRSIKVDFADAENVGGFAGYDAVIMYGRRLVLSAEQQDELELAADKGIPVFTNSPRRSESAFNRNLTQEERAMLQMYFDNACQKNYRNMLRYMRHIATPQRGGGDDVEAPVELPHNLFYHQEAGQYFRSHEELTEYLRRKRMYHEHGCNVALISGITFPVESNRAHVDTLISRLTQGGFNVYPLTAMGKEREDMLHSLHPDAIVYFPMGRLGDDELVKWAHRENILIFSPFIVSQPRKEWLDVSTPVSGGTMTARLVIPEIDGCISPLCIATQEEDENGYFLWTPVPERVDAFMDNFTRHIALRRMPNKDKRIAICYFKSPGKDDLQASGMEVVPSLYNFLKRLRAEGYDVGGLPADVETFRQQLYRDGSVMGAYAKGAQKRFMDTAHPVWLTSRQYEEWARETLLPEKYKEVTDRYGDAPGNLLARGDSMAVACLQFGNVWLFPQPRPALGEDEFKLVHGMPVAPPHSYIAPYLYMLKGFKADALIHFGTHGNLEFTPGKNVGLSQADWADVLVGNLPHFYFYTTGNVGESVIAKRRTHAVLVTYLTPPYVESGMRQRYSALLSDIHKVLESGEGSRAREMRVKKEVVRLGLHRSLGLDSVADKPYTHEELERIDCFTEEIANEKITGACYTMGEPYSERDLCTTVLAMAADPLAYEMARRDCERGRISRGQLQDFAYIAHHYLPEAKWRLERLLQNPPSDTVSVEPELRQALLYYRQLKESTRNEFDTMVRALNGGSVCPAPGGDPVLNPNVLPTGRNMYSVNAETSPNAQAWEDGKRLAETTLMQYMNRHGEYPHKVSYTFWAGEFIATEGATLAQAFWMIGVEPVRDSQGHVVDLRLVPENELCRPRIDVVVQVSGQLRDIAASRLKLLTKAVALAAEAEHELYPNFVAEGTLSQEKQLVAKGLSPKEARKMAGMRVFGPVNSGYSTGIMGYVENSGAWDDENEIAEGYLNNMGAVYGDDENWGDCKNGVFAAALAKTDVVVQPRQSNTWGPVSLDHVYEFTGGLSLAVRHVTGKEPDAYMADYRNRMSRRMQNAKEAVAVETRATILNPTFVRERMKGGAGTAQQFGKTFRNIFGWHVTRPSSMDKNLFNDLYDMYIKDENGLGIYEYFRKVNPAALQTITSVMLESVRKGYWKASEEQLRTTVELHTRITCEAGAACTEFVCGNAKLQEFIAGQLDEKSRRSYNAEMSAVHELRQAGKMDVVLKKQELVSLQDTSELVKTGWAAGIVVAVLVIAGTIVVKKRKREQI